MDKSNQQASSRDKDLSWLAAALESEGWFIFHISDRRKKGRKIEVNPTVGVCNTDWQFIQICNEISRKWLTGCHIKIHNRKRKPQHSRAYKVIWAGMKRVNKLLRPLIPYMRSGKKRRAELLLRFIESRFQQTRIGFENPKNIMGVQWSYKPFTSEQIAILIELKRLNSKGPNKEIAKGTLEKLQRLNTEQYKNTDDKVQVTEM